MKHFGGIDGLGRGHPWPERGPFFRRPSRAQIPSRPKPRTPMPRTSPLRAVRACRRRLGADDLEDGRVLLRCDIRRADGRDVRPDGGKQPAVEMRDRIGVEIAPDNLGVRHRAGQRLHDRG